MAGSMLRGFFGGGLSSRQPLILSSSPGLPAGALEAELLQAPLSEGGGGEGHDAPSVDIHSQVGLTTGTLRRLHLVAGTTVLISALDGSAARYGRAVALNDPRAGKAAAAGVDGVAYLSPVLAFNLQLALHLRGFLGAPRPRVFVVAAGGAPDLRSCRVALVREPAELADTLCRAVAPDTTEELERALRAYASVPRLVAPGDAFACPVPDEGEPGRTRTCAFRVTACDPAGGGRLSPRTHTLLDGSCAGPAPPAPSLGGFAHAPTREDGDDPAPPPPPTAAAAAAAQPPAVASLCAIAAPLVHPAAAKLRLRCAVLLIGPQGVGKRGVAQAAAAALGMHCVTFNCHELGGESEGKTAAALEQAFEAAAQYAPAVLLLRRAGALQPAAQPGAVPDAGQAGVRPSPLVARALEAAVRRYSHGGAAAADGAAGPGGGWEGEGGDDDGGDDDDNDDGGDGEGGDGDDGGAAAAAGGGGGNPLAPKPRVWKAPRRRGGGGAQPPATVLLLACCESADALPPDVRRAFTHELHVHPPGEAARGALLGAALGAALPPGGLLDLAPAASATAGLMPRDLRAIAAEAVAAGAARAVAEGAAGGPPSVTQAELDAAVRAAAGRTNAAIGAPRVPTVSWADVGGLEDAKRTILDTVQLPLRHKALFASGGRRRSGALLYGPPGTGKTLLAKAVATECGVRFLAVKGPELINMYIGESERNVREVFARARAARPCIVFFDELDALAPARGGGGDSGGVMDRVVSQLLAEVDGLAGEGGDDVFVIGATNRPDLIDPALLRPGRFDKLLYVGVDGSEAGRLRVLQALTRKFVLAPDVDLPALARACPARYTGADVYALCADAWMRAVKGRLRADAAAASGAAQQPGPASDAPLPVAMADFEAAMADLAPSLSAGELERYQALADSFSKQGPAELEFLQ